MLQIEEEFDEDDYANACVYSANEMELHHNIAEIIGVLFKTQTRAFLPAYLRHFHEKVCPTQPCVTTI
jgi:hypothetical protein